jgi:hypothetical protein
MRKATTAVLVAVATAVATLAAAAPAEARDGGLEVRLVGADRCAPVPTVEVVRWEERVERVVIREGHWRVEVVRAARHGWAYDARCRRWTWACLEPERRERRWVPEVVEHRVVRVPVVVRVPAPPPPPPPRRGAWISFSLFR